MNCPECDQPILEMSIKCRHCGAEIDDKTFCLNEDQVMAEIQAAREAKAQKEQAFKATDLLGKVLAGGGFVIMGACLAMLKPPVALYGALAGLVCAGIGIGLAWSARG